MTNPSALELKHNDRLRFDKIANQLDLFVSGFATEQMKILRADDEVTVAKAREHINLYWTEWVKFSDLLEKVLKLAQLPDSLRAEIAAALSPPSQA